MSLFNFGPRKCKATGIIKNVEVIESFTFHYYAFIKFPGCLIPIVLHDETNNSVTMTESYSAPAEYATRFDIIVPKSTFDKYRYNMDELNKIHIDDIMNGDRYREFIKECTDKHPGCEYSVNIFRAQLDDDVNTKTEQHISMDMDFIY